MGFQNMKPHKQKEWKDEQQKQNLQSNKQMGATVTYLLADHRKPNSQLAVKNSTWFTGLNLQKNYQLALLDVTVEVSYKPANWLKCF